MRSPLASLAGSGFFALLLSSAAAAQATTITYSSNSATYVPNPNSTVNTRPLQLNSTGNPMAVTRNYIFTGLNTDPLAGNWVPSGQAGPAGDLASGEQRFDYLLGSATASLPVPGPPTENLWVDKANLSFGSFYLDGSCLFCGSANKVTITSASNTAQAQYKGADPNGNSGNQNSLVSDIYNITFGASGYTGTLRYTAATDVTFGSPDIQLSRGTITLEIFAPVPAPLPLFGAGAAFGMSRQLRRRIQRQAKGISAKG